MRAKYKAKCQIFGVSFHLAIHSHISFNIYLHCQHCLQLLWPFLTGHNVHYGQISKNGQYSMNNLAIYMTINVVEWDVYLKKAENEDNLSKN